MGLVIKLDVTYGEALDVWLSLRSEARRQQAFAQSKHLPDTLRQDATRWAEEAERIATKVHDAMVAQTGGE